MSQPPQLGLDPDQEAAASAGDGPTLVIAGAGTGKTRALVGRVAWLLHRGVPASRILLLTFTNRAAQRMIAAVNQLGLPNASEVVGGTFHSIAYHLLELAPAAVGFPRGFHVIDAPEARASFLALAREHGFDARTAERLHHVCSLCLNARCDVTEALARRAPSALPRAEEVRALFRASLQSKVARGVMDFDDLLLWLVALLDSEHPIAQGLRQRFDHVLIDEFQDTNALQSRIVQALASGSGNVMAVGDDAQAIYGFRGADVTHLLRFTEHFPHARVLTLTRNYRSTAPILAFANASIAHNAQRVDKTLVAVRSEPGVDPIVALCPDPEAEAAFVAERIDSMLAQGASPHHIAVLYRSHRQSRLIQEALTRLGIAVQTRSTLGVLEHPGARLTVDLLQLALRPEDRAAQQRVLSTLDGLSPRDLTRALTVIEQALSLPDALADLRLLKLLPAPAHPTLRQLAAFLRHAPGAMPVEAVEQALLLAAALHLPASDDAAETLRALAAWYRVLADFVADAILGGMELIDRPCVTLSTIHQAKGLEWAAVFVLGLADGVFPALRDGDPPEAIEEERRLFFVALTRATDHLALCVPGAAPDYTGLSRPRAPSRFLAEIGVTTAAPDAPPAQLWRIQP